MNMSTASVLEYEPVRISAGSEQKIEAVLHSITYLAEGIRSFEFVASKHGKLPAFIAGSHIDIHLPSGFVRQYSLCNSPLETHRYVVAVLREASGRGGSIAMHDNLATGDEVVISTPRNHFALAPNAKSHTFVAGGIGITPIMSMIAEAVTRKEPFHLYYCTRTRVRTAFLEELQPYVEAGQATIHHDEGNPCSGLDLAAALQQNRPGEHLYYCGPPGFMDAVQAAATHWAPDTVHFERFTAPIANGESIQPDNLAESFDVKLARSGKTFRVEAGQTIVEVLKKNGVMVDVSCEEGYCGTCMTRYLDGQPIHNDTVLDEEDRKGYLMVCCASERWLPSVGYLMLKRQ